MTTHKISPAPAGTFSSAFVLPVTRDGRVLLARERRGNEEKFALLGGKAHPKEDAFACAAREAKEETGGALSAVTCLRVARGAGGKGEVVEYKHPAHPAASRCVAMMHDLVVPADATVDQRFDIKEAARLRAKSENGLRQPAIAKKKRASKTVQLGTSFVPLADLRNHQWRQEHMFTFPHNVLAARLLETM